MRADTVLHPQITDLLLHKVQGGDDLSGRILVCGQLVGLLLYLRIDDGRRLIQGLSPGHHIGPTGKLADTQHAIGLIPGGSITLQLDGRNILLLPQDLALAGRFTDLDLHVALLGRLKEQSPARSHQQTQAVAGNRHIPVHGQHLAVTPAHHRIISLQGVAVFKHVTHPDIWQDQVGGPGTRVEKTRQIGLALKHPQLIRLQAVQRFAIAPHPSLVDGQGFVARIEIKSELRGFLQPLGAADLDDEATESLNLG